MRETCVRVLAAALMTGAIAAVVWMSALAGTPDETIRPLAAPAAARPPSVTIRVNAVSAPKPHVRRGHRLPATTSVAAATAAIAGPLATVHPRRAKRPARHLAATTAKPSASAPPTKAPAATPVPSAPRLEPLDAHGNGHAYGHERARGKGHEKHEE